MRLLFIFVIRLTLQYRFTTNKHQRWDLIVCCCGYIKYVHYPWFEWFGSLYTLHTGFGGIKAQEDKLHTCYCSHAIQHIMWYVHTLLMYYSLVSHEISRVTRMWVSSLNWAVLYKNKEDNQQRTKTTIDNGKHIHKNINTKTKLYQENRCK